MDATAALNESSAGTYQYAFEKFLAVHYGTYSEHLPPSLCDGGLAGVLPADHADTVEVLCFDINYIYDRHFVDELYDDLPFEP